MPLFKQWEIGDTATAAIWKIEEPLSFFREQTGLESAINSEKRRTEHLAGRFLLKHLDSGFPLHLIEKDEHDKPNLPNNECFFSISHSWPFVAVVIDTEKDTGIDIQTWHPRVADIQHKYLSQEEQQIVGADPKMITLAWCAKESAYKWYGKKGVEFIEELPIVNFEQGSEYNISIYFLRNKVPQMIFVESIMNTDFGCAYIANVQDWVIY